MIYKIYKVHIFENHMKIISARENNSIFFITNKFLTQIFLKGNLEKMFQQ